MPVWAQSHSFTIRKMNQNNLENTPTAGLSPEEKSRVQALRATFVTRVLSVTTNVMDIKTHLSKAFPDTAGDLGATLDQLDDLKRCLDSFRPLNPSQLENLQRAWDTEYTYESNRIEGNTLTLQETHMVIAKGMTIKGKTLDEHLEARNHQAAIGYIRELSAQDATLTESLVNHIHSIVLGGIRPLDAGVYRKLQVGITGARHVPPPPYLVARQMEEVFHFYDENATTLHPVVLAADMHEKIVTVHPWIDGNGRTSRLVMNLILLQHGFPIARISGDDESRLTYYAALEQAQVDGKADPFRSLVAEYVKFGFFDYLSAVVVNSGEEMETVGGYFYERMAPSL